MLLRGNKVSDCLWQAKELMEPISLDEHPDYEDFIFKPMDLKNLEKVCKHSVFWKHQCRLLFS